MFKNIFIALLIGCCGVGMINHAYAQITRDTVTRYYSISQVELVSENNSGSYSMDENNLYPNTAGFYYAPIHLPDSAQVLELRVWLLDNIAGDINVRMMIKSYDNTFGGIMSEIATSGTPGYVELFDTTISYNRIDNLMYKYFLRINLVSGHTFRSARIKYRLINGSVDIMETGQVKSDPPLNDLKILPSISNRTFNVNYALTSASPVNVRIYDIGGRLVRQLVDENKMPGDYSIVWDSRDDKGRELESGRYFCIMEAQDYQSKAVIIIK